MKTKAFKKTTAIFLLSFILLLSACSPGASIVGTWQLDDPLSLDENIKRFTEDGRVLWIIEGEEIDKGDTYAISGNILIETHYGNHPVEMTFAVSGDTLTTEGPPGFIQVYRRID